MLKFKPFILFTLFFTIALLSVGCETTTLTGSGKVVTQEKAITGFDRVEVRTGFTVDVRQGETFSVVIRVDDNIVEHLHVLKVGSTLKIGLNPERIYRIRQATLEAEVTMPNLAGLALSESSQGTITGFKSAQPVEISLSGNSSLQGDIEAGRSSFELSGGSEVALVGSAQAVTIDASGNSIVNLTDIPVTDANVLLSGGSEATVNPSGRLDVQASGNSYLYYLGKPTMGMVGTSGGSSVEAK